MKNKLYRKLRRKVAIIVREKAGNNSYSKIFMRLLVMKLSTRILRKEFGSLNLISTSK
jgi:hypothetical protein